jgi:hypothetical protein
MSEFVESLASLLRKPARDIDEKPFQGEFYSVERLEQYAYTLAAQHTTVTRNGRALLLPRLDENGRKLEDAYKALVDALRNGRAISPAAEWLVDNYHIVEEQLREIRQDLPKSYYRELPKLAGGELQGYPRIYAVALALITHTDSTPTHCAVSSPPIKPLRLYLSANSGPSQSLCASLSLKTCAVWPSPSRARAPNAKKPTNSPTSYSNLLPFNPRPSTLSSANDSANANGWRIRSSSS